jgi:putative ABC transport system permease protein
MNVFAWIWRDLRYTGRSFKQGTGSTVLAVLSLALGIGATTAIFSVVDSVLLHPFPYKEADRLVLTYIQEVGQSGLDGRFWFSVPEFIDYRDRNRSFADLMGAAAFDVLYTSGDNISQFDGALVTPNIFESLGARPSLGRIVTETDGSPGSPLVFVMSDRLWRKRFHQDKNVLGTTMTLNGQARTMVAIMPPRFLLLNADIWIPMKVTPSAPYPYVWALGRLKPGISFEATTADIDAIARDEARTYPHLYPERFRVLVGTLGEQYSRDLKGSIYILFAAVLLLLMIACSNVANLLLVKATSREKELAVRSALGATKGRLVRQLFLESFVLAACGSIAGCGLAYAALKWIAAVIPPNTIPVEVAIKLSPAALFVTVAATIVTTLLCGVAPALYVARADLCRKLAGTGKGTNGARHGAFRHFVIASQVALSVLLLVGAGLMMRTFLALQYVDIGLSPTNVLSASVSLPPSRYGTAAEKKLFFRTGLQRVTSLPGVVSAATAVSSPLQGDTIHSNVDVEGKTHSDTRTAMIELCSEGFFRTLGISLMRGRLLSETDVDAGRHVAVVNSKLARDFFGENDVIGRTMSFMALGQGVGSFEIVGVVADAKNDSFRQPILPEAFIPYTVTSLPNATILVKTATAPLAMAEDVRKAVWEVDRTLPFPVVSSLEDILYESNLAAPKFALILLGVFAGIGLALSAIGVFSVMAHSVALETHEIGIRMAIGALPGRVLSMVLRKGLQSIVIGLFFGLLACVGLTRLLANEIWGVSATDPVTFAVVSAILVLIGLVACLFPAIRAARVEPLIALRED